MKVIGVFFGFYPAQQGCCPQPRVVSEPVVDHPQMPEQSRAEAFTAWALYQDEITRTQFRTTLHHTNKGLILPG